MTTVVYADDFEAITGQKIPVETKVITAPEPPVTEPTPGVEVKAPDAAPAAPVVDPTSAPVAQQGA